MSYTINGQSQELSDPSEQNGVTLLPLVGIAETLGGYVYWNNESKEAIIEMDDKRSSVTAGDTNLLMDGEVKSLSAAPMIVNAHLYVPTDFFETALGCTVDISGGDVTISRNA